MALLKSTSLNKFRSLTLKKLGATLESTTVAIKTFTATEERIPVENQSLKQTAQTCEKKLVLEIISTQLSSTWNSEMVQSASLGELIMPLCDHTSHVTFCYQPIKFGNIERKRSFLKAWILLACYRNSNGWQIQLYILQCPWFSNTNHV